MKFRCHRDDGIRSVRTSLKRTSYPPIDPIVIGIKDEDHWEVEVEVIEVD